MIPLAVLDLSPVTTAISGGQALRNSLDLAQHADRLGYTRYWVAEHHNLPSIASSAPDIMIGQIAARDQAHARRLGRRDAAEPRAADGRRALQGAGGCFPGASTSASAARPAPTRSRPTRCGAGRTFRPTMTSSSGSRNCCCSKRGFPENHPFRNVRAMPADVPLPPIWLLGSSGYSAQLAAAVGTGYSFAHHFANHDAVSAMRSYRDHFRASPTLQQPYAILAVHVVSADTEEEAERLASTVDLNFVRRAKGEYAPLASPEEALAYPYTPTVHGSWKTARACSSARPRR